ncbi:MAG: DUF2341 domain-containing protein [Myxococcota bacterium]|nr:DUF2341 domain-containing protein [Myxococcota bacterium]
MTALVCGGDARADTVTWSTQAEFLAGTLADVEVDGAGLLTLTQAAPWSMVGWSDRFSIAVSESAGVDLTDYSVQVTLDTQVLIAAGTLQGDGADLRFTDDQGSVLGHWVESGINTSTTLVWVEVPWIPAWGSATLLCYHGNPGASDTSSKAAAMLWWDDFSTDTLASYESQGLEGHGPESWTISGGWLSNTNAIYGYETLLAAGLTLDGNFLMETVADTDDDDGLGLATHVDGNGSSYYSVQTWAAQGDRCGIGRSVTEGDVTAPANVTISPGSTHTYRVTATGGTLTMFLDGAAVVSYTDPSPLSGTRLGVLETHLDPPGYFDSLLIRAYVEPELSAAPGGGGSYLSPGAWVSDVVDSGCPTASWDAVGWVESLPAGTDVTFSVRGGDTPAPDGSWSGWGGETSDPAGSTPGIGETRFGQVRTTLTSTGGDTPTVSDVTLTFTPDCGGDDDVSGDDDDTAPLGDPDSDVLVGGGGCSCGIVDRSDRAKASLLPLLWLLWRRTRNRRIVGGW